MKAARFASLLVIIFFSSAAARAVTIATVPIGNPGNPADMRYVDAVHPNGTGSVSASYKIGKTEVTNAQYTALLNAVDPTGANTLALYNGNMSSDAHGGIIFNGGAANGSKYEIKLGRDNNPVVFVSWYDAIRFANWLHNGQGGPGSTEFGAYTLLGGTPTPSNGLSITRNAGAKWWLPSEDEWYKAAYHKNDGVTGNYWNYPTSTNTQPYSDQPPGTSAPDPSNTANFWKDDGVTNGYNDGYAVTGLPESSSLQNYLTDVGAYTLSTSPYGTFDQGGNVWEWNETLSGSVRGLRGGGWVDNILSPNLHAALRYGDAPTIESVDVGFRVASIPEPSSLMLCLTGMVISILLIRANR